MKRYWMVALVMALLLIGTQFAMAAGNQYISGSRDGEGFVGSDGHSFLYIRGTTDIIMEGATSDANEATLRIPDPGSDIIYTFPATTGTLSLVGGAGGTLADGKIYIGNNSGGGTAVAADVSGFFTIVNTGATTGTLADGKIYIGNNVGGGAAVAVTMSGDATLANSGALTIGANKIGTAEFNVNTVAVVTPATSVGGTATVTTGSTILGYYGVANIHDSAYNGITNVSISGQTLLVIVNGTSGTNAVVHNVVVLEP